MVTSVTNIKPRKISKNIPKTWQTSTLLLTFDVPITINLYSLYHDYHLTVAENVSFAFKLSKLL